MYRKDDGQITIAEFISPFGKLDPKNRWVKKSAMIPWEQFEEKYASQFCENNGAPAKPFRMALAALLIKQELRVSDEETVEQITENPYLQFFIGLHEFTTEAPFVTSMMVYFRKRITAEMMSEINEAMFGKPSGKDQPPSLGGACGDTMPNAGTIMLDATCTPANIAYPTDVNLLNEAREKLEGIIDALHPHTGKKQKPRTYRQKARKHYLQFTKNRKPAKKLIRKAIRQQLSYVRRNLHTVESLLAVTETAPLSNNQKQWLQTIRKLYNQQQSMYDKRTHSIADRIVSISQPHVRPIVRGKVSAPVEFGAKVSISLIDGYGFIDRLAWDAYNEQELLIPTVEAYKAKNGFYPEAVLADKIYRNRENLAYCKKYGIRLSGPRLGRPPKERDYNILRQQRLDSAQRNAVEGKFGEGKTGYGLDRIMACLKATAETVISVAFFAMNLNRRLRVFLSFLFRWIFDLQLNLIFDF